MERIYIAEGVATAMAVAEAVQDHDMDGSGHRGLQLREPRASR